MRNWAKGQVHILDSKEEYYLVALDKQHYKVWPLGLGNELGHSSSLIDSQVKGVGVKG